MNALETGDDRNFATILEARDQVRPVDVDDARRRVRIGGVNRQLPALPRSGVDADGFERDRQQTGRDLLAGRYYGVVLARIVQHCCVPAPFDQPVGGPRHRGSHHRDLVAGVDLTLDVAGNVADVLDIGDRGAAEFHHQAGHGRIVTLRQTGRIHSGGS